MKLILTLIMFLNFSVLAGPIILDDHDFKLTDIASLNIDKKDLFGLMDRTIVRTQDSICSNRAQIWGYDYKRKQKLDSGKIFLFFTSQTYTYWWYHAANVINEKGKFWVMDAGFPNRIKGPLLLKDWLKEFNGAAQCKRIRLGDNELLEKIYSESLFPTKTSYGSYGCYYIISPATYWTPNQIAMNMLGRDSNGNPVRYSKETIDKNDVYEACLETSTDPIGYALRLGHRICRGYLTKIR